MLIGYEFEKTAAALPRKTAQDEGGEEEKGRSIECPNCRREVRAEVESEDGQEVFTCPNCGYHGPVSGKGEEDGEGGGPKEGSRRVGALLAQAALAPTHSEQRALVGAVEELRTRLVARTAAERGLDLAGAVVREHLTPVRVHERHTAATDWIGELGVEHQPDAVQHAMLTRATLWYAQTPQVVKAHPEEFAEQLRGTARRLAGGFGTQAGLAEATFTSHAAGLHRKEAAAGAFHEASEPSGPNRNLNAGDAAPTPSFDTMPAGSDYQGLPGPETSSERAGQIEQLQAADPSHDVGAAGLDSDQVDRANNDAGDPLAADLSAGTDRMGTTAATAAVEHVTAPNDDPRCGAARVGESGPEMCNRAPHPDQDHGQWTQFHNQNEWRGDYSTQKSSTNTSTWPKCSVCGKGVSPVEAAMGGPSNVHTPCLSEHNRRKESSMQTAHCPTCGGRGKVAVRTVAPREYSIGEIMAGRHLGVSGLDQVQQTVDPHDEGYRPTPLPEEVAFPIVWDPNNVGRVISENEAQLEQRRQMSGTARRRQVAELAGREAYRRVLAGQDDSGWAGDMGAGGYGPGQQDGGNPGGPTNLATPDEVYGWGGDNPNRPLKPYGAAEAEDYTSNPGMDYQPGQPTQADEAGRVQTTQGPAGGGGAPFPNPPINNGRKSSAREDPEIAKALAFVRQRRALLESRG